MTRTVVVWGNCQAGPLADLLRVPLAACDYEIVPTPPVYLLDAATLSHARRALSSAAVLITQPVSDDYHLAGCGTASIVALLPADARVITFGVAHHVGAFPYQTNAHGGDGARVLAPVTDYHDLRAITAAQRGMNAHDAASWWPEPDADVVRSVAAAATTELARREERLDIGMAEQLLRPDALWTMTHPTNVSMAAIARAVLRLLELPDTIEVPGREYLGQRRAPIESAVVAALGWPGTAVRGAPRPRGHPRTPARPVRAPSGHRRRHGAASARTVAPARPRSHTLTSIRPSGQRWVPTNQASVTWRVRHGPLTGPMTTVQDVPDMSTPFVAACAGVPHTTSLPRPQL